MINLQINNIIKILFYILIPLSILFFYQSLTHENQSEIKEGEIFNISFNNQTISIDFISLFNDKTEVSEDASQISFQELGIELAGIVSINNQPNRGYIILNFTNKKSDKKIFKPGDKIENNVFLESIYSNSIKISINNQTYQIYLSDKKRVTEVDGVINLDVSLLEILPYLKINQGSINGTLGVYISDRVDGNIIKKLHLKETDLLFNLSGYNVFNLATLSDAYRKLENRKEIVASIYRDGKITKLIARRIDV
jgi:type II secretory pathway component PulC